MLEPDDMDDLILSMGPRTLNLKDQNLNFTDEEEHVTEQPDEQLICELEETISPSQATYP